MFINNLVTDKEIQSLDILEKNTKGLFTYPRHSETSDVDMLTPFKIN